MTARLMDLIANRRADPQAVIDELNRSYVPSARTRYNSEFGPRYFGRPPVEPVPTDPRRLTDFRSRLGALIEYGLGVTLDALFQEDFGPGLRWSFVVANQYPDFYVRDLPGGILLRIDCKLLHDESDEYSARFALPVADIAPEEDLLLYGAWQWRTMSWGGHPLVYPHVLELLVVPAIDVAEERDRHLAIRGGRIESDGRAIVPPNWAPDTNYGKINRIVHRDRREAPDLSPNVRAFLDFTRRHSEAVRRAAGEEAVGTPTADEVVAPPTD